MVEEAVISEKVVNAGFAIAGVLKWILIAILIVGLLVGFFFFLKSRKKYIHKDEIWGSVGGIPDIIINDKSRPIKVRTKEGISSIMFFKKLKRYLKMPNRLFFIGKRIRFWFRQDGELTPIMPVKTKFFDWKFDREAGEKIWVGESAENIMKQARENEEIFCPVVLEDVNEKFACMKVKFINEDARLAHVSAAKIVRDMFSLNKFFKEHGATIMMILGVLVLVFAFVMFVDGTKGMGDNNQAVADALGRVADRFDKVNEGTIQVLERLDSLYKTPQNAIPTGS
jgi:hypothetical protein